MNVKKIIHVDMDAFYASVEQRDNPNLKGRPVIVGGPPDSRGVVASCSYEARKYGIHSAMPSSRAYRLCPKAVFVRGRFDAYHEASEKINNIFNRYTDLVEPLSLDEAYLDVTDYWKEYSSATSIAEEIRQSIKRETDLTASAGVSYNKFLAKIASDCNKPDGITIVTPSRAEIFIENLPVRKIFGVGKMTEKKMEKLGIHYGRDLKKLSLFQQVEYFGKAGQYFYNIVRGIDNREVETQRVRKSIGKERTFSSDVSDINDMYCSLESISEDVASIMNRKGINAFTVTLKVKYFDFEQTTRSRSFSESFNDKKDIFDVSRDLLLKTKANRKSVRLLGISMSNLDDESSIIDDRQLVFAF